MLGLLDIFSKYDRLGMAEYSDIYMKNIKQLHSLSNSDRFLRSHIRSKNLIESEDFIRFSLVFNDLSLFEFSGTKELGIIMLQPEWFRLNFDSPEVSVSMSAEKLQSLGLDVDNPKIIPSYIFPRGEEIDRFTEKVYPFLESGRLIIHPGRALFHASAKSENGGTVYKDIEVSQDSPLQCWEVLEEQPSRPIIISEAPIASNQRALFEITVPYLQGVDFSDLAKIMEDESDLLSALRISIKQVVDQGGSLSDPMEIVRDIIDPKVDSINRRFRSITNTQSFKIAGAAVGTVALAYTSVATFGLSSALAAIGGAGGVGAIGNAYSDYRSQINEVKNDPFYFLWRCKKSMKY